MYHVVYYYTSCNRCVSLYIIIYRWVNSDKIIIIIIVRDCKTTTTAIIIIQTNIILFIGWHCRVSVHKRNLLLITVNRVSNLVIVLYRLKIKCLVKSFQYNTRLSRLRSIWYAHAPQHWYSRHIIIIMDDAYILFYIWCWLNSLLYRYKLRKTRKKINIEESLILSMQFWNIVIISCIKD